MAQKFIVTFEDIQCDESRFVERACQRAQDWSARFPKRARPVRIKLGRDIVECTVTNEVDSNIVAHTLFIRRKETPDDEESVTVSAKSRNDSFKSDERRVDEAAETRDSEA